MPLRPVNVSVPLGKGVDESVDPHVLQPPGSRRAENLRPEHGGSLRHRPGFTPLHGVTGTSNANVLVADGDRALLLGPNPTVVISPDGAGQLSHASPLPLSLRTHRLRAIAGFGHSAQVAHYNGYTAVIVSVLGDVTTYASGAGYLQHDYACEVMIYDAQWRIAWGPHRLAALKWLPRVEAISNGRFVFFALGSTDGDSGEVPPWKRGALADAIQLYTAQGYVGGPAPTATSIAGVSPVAGDASLTRWKIYDTHAAKGEDRAYATFISLGPALTIVSTDGSVAWIDRIDRSLTSTKRDHSVAIWRDADSDTVLVYHAGDAALWYAPGNLASAPLISPTPTLDGVEGLSSVDHFAGSHPTGSLQWGRYQVPEFYVHPNGLLYLNEHSVTLTGSSPATPSFGAAITPALAHLHRPQAITDATLYFRAQIAHGDVGLRRGWGSWMEVYHLAAHPSYGGAARPTVDLAVLETRFGAEALGHLTFETFLSDQGTATYPCVTGQTARHASGAILLASLPLIDQGRVRSEVGSNLPVALSSSLINAETFNTVSAGAGYLNDEQHLVVSEIVPGVPTYSAEHHEASMLVAAGMPSIWSGSAVHPIVPRRPMIARYAQPDLISIPAARQLDPRTVGLVDASAGGTDHIDYSRSFRAKVVLVFVDANGIEYRSAPSPSVFATGVTNDGDFPEHCPVLDIIIEPSTLALVGSGRALDVELYVTERRDAAGTEPDEGTYTMVARMPLQRDSSGWFALDLMQDLVVQLDSVAGAWVDQFASPPHVTPLYTLTGEKPNMMPPASYVSAQVAGYAFLLSAENPYEVWTSKPLVKGRSPEWNPELIVYAPPACGGVVSLASAYDRLYLLCRNGVWEQPVYGGPSATGGAFGAPPQLVYRGAGCISHMGTVETPVGVFYVSAGGPRLLTGEGSVDIGRAVRTALDWRSVTAATYDPAQDEVTWWTTSKSVSYSVRFQAWTTSTLGARAAAVWDGGDVGNVVIRVTDDGELVQETRTTTRDVGTPTLARVTSPWLNFGDTQGYKRVWEVMVLGRIHSGTVGGIRISLEYDYVETVVDSYEWTLTEILALSRGFQLSVKPRRQQVDAIRITVEQTNELVGGKGGEQGQQPEPTPDSDIDWTITGINVRVGAKMGLMKLQSEAKK